MRRGAIVLELAAALAVASAPCPARAAELLLEQPSVCAIGDDLPSRAERALGRPLASAAPVRCTIGIEREGDVFAAQMVLSTPGAPAAAGRRSFRAPTCELLADTLALAVALAVGESESAAPGPSIAASAAALEPAALPPAVSPPAPAPDRAPPESDAGASLEVEARAGSELHGGVRAGLVTDAGTLPGVGLGAALGISLGGDWIEGRALGTYLAPRDAASPSRPGAGAEFELLAAELALCAPSVVQISRLRAGVCLGGELGALSARAHGFLVSGERYVLWRAGRLDVEGRWALASGVDVELALSALAPLVRHRFVVDEFRPEFVSAWYSQATLYSPQPIVARASIGLSIELGGRD